MKKEDGCDSAPPPLKGLRVLDFSQVFAGPHTSVWLGLLGAEVIKIESATRLDRTRFFKSLGQEKPDEAALFMGLNHSKKSCALNLRTSEGVEIALKLAALSDIVLENFSAGTMERLGVGYEQMKAVNPDIIVLSLTGLGRTGPYKNFLAYGPGINAYALLTSQTGYPGRSPVSPWHGWADAFSGQAGVFAVLAALRQRVRTGQGQHIDLAMSEVAMVSGVEAIQEHVFNGRAPTARGNRDRFFAPSGLYRCKGDDEWVAISTTSEEEWGSLCEAVDQQGWSQDSRFASLQARLKHQDELDRMLETWTISRTAEEATRILQAKGVPASPSFKPEQILEDPHLRERKAIGELWSSTRGAGKAAELPGRLRGVWGRQFQPAPSVGEHNRYVLCDILGLSEEDVARLIEEKIAY